MRKNTTPTRQQRHDDQLAQHRHWLSLAEKTAQKPIAEGGSPHPTVRVGAVLVDAKGQEIAATANRFAHGVDRRRPERYASGSKSLWFNCAEQMVLMRALHKRVDLTEAKLYVTLEPCAVCAGLISEAGIKHVFVPVGSLRRYAKLKAKWKESIEIGLVKLAESGVTVTAIDLGGKKKT